MATIWYVFLAIVLLGVMIFTHELGHFIVGRVCGFAIEEFSIGFGWKILGWRRKEIDYSLRVLPLGGYVRFTGEDEASDNPRAFNNMPVWKRMLVAVAGVSMNFITAFLAILILFNVYGAIQLPVITEVAALSAAEEALEGVRIKVPEEETDEVCELCGRNMVIKMGRFGKFLACPGFPDCKNAKPLVERMPGRCPKCGSGILKRKSKKGYAYYACEKGAECGFMSWDVPTEHDCPECGQTMFKKSGKGRMKPFCINENCSQFLPEDKRGYYKKKTEESADTEKPEKKTTKRTAAKKPAKKTKEK